MYSKPGQFDNLRDGLLSYETRHCGRGVPTISNTPTPVPPAPSLPQLNLPTPVPQAVDGVTGLFSYSQKLFDDIITFAFPQGSGSGAAPRCQYQGPYTVQGETSQFPHLKPD